MHKTIAYFSAEYSVADSLPIYAGGLGILAGDIVQEAGAEGRDFHAVGLVYHEAFTAGESDTRPIVERLRAEGFEVAAEDDGRPIILNVAIGGARVAIQAWRKSYGTSSLILLDTRLPTNSPEDWRITNHLYDGTMGMMFTQQLLLAFGGVAFLHKLDITPEVYHLNEGHMAFVGLALALDYQRHHPRMHLVGALEAVKPKLAASKHTILPGAGLTLEREVLKEHLGTMLAKAHGSVDDLMALGGKDDGYFSTTKFLIGIAGRHSGVSEIHVQAEAAAHPGSPLIAVTNGVFQPRWRATTWPREPLKLDDEAYYLIHRGNRHRLLEYVHNQTGKQMEMRRLTVVWARRMTAYKRPDLLVNNLERLTALARHAERPIQFVIAGKANPADATGIELMNHIIMTSQRPELTASFAYLPHFNPMTARLLVQGADLWLNTPVRGQEACGTSGMKASLNGALQFSTSDGWIDEADIKPIGWELPTENAETAIYDILENDIAPLFYDRHNGLPLNWIKMMRTNMDLVERQFCASRMLGDYYEKLYQ